MGTVEPLRERPQLYVIVVVGLMFGFAWLLVVSAPSGPFLDSGPPELTTDFGGEDLVETDELARGIAVTVVTEGGEPVPGTEVTVESGTVVLDAPQLLGTTDESGTVRGTVYPDEIDFESGTQQGTLTFSLDPPGEGNYTDAEPNAKLTVVASS